MSGDSRTKLRKCTCNYKCRHTPLGFSYVSTRLYHHHCRQDVAGKSHYSRKHAMQATRSVQILQSTQHLENVVRRTRRVKCDCKTFCSGGRLVHPATLARHQELQARYNNIASTWGMLPQDNTGNNEVGLDETSPMDTIHMDTSQDQDTSQYYKEDPKEPSIEDQIIERCIDLQALWDKYRTPKQFQDEMLHVLFGDMAGSKDTTNSNTNTKSSLSKLLVQLPPTWNGDLNGVGIPTCWRQLVAMYSGLGMHDLQSFRLCTGVEGSPHSPKVYHPSKEDNYVNNLVYCLCSESHPAKKILKRDCLSCCEKCTECMKPRKDMVSFEYAPIAPQLELICRSRSNCYEFSRMWRNRERWLGKQSEEHPDRINEFWDGEKCREAQAFWDPNSIFELPVICEQSFCRKIYATFPKRCQILEDSWDEHRRVYDFIRIECRSSIECGRRTCKGECKSGAKKTVDALVTEVYKVAPTSIRYGRWPHFPSKYHKSFKAEENQKFIQWCLPVILRNIVDISKPLLELGQLLIDVAHIFYNYSRDKGWSQESLTVVRSLLISWRIRNEEYYGPNSSPLEHVAGNGEMLDDIYRHGNHDVYWCYDFERKVSTYVNISTNMKSNEISYSQYFRRKVFISTFRNIQMDRDGLLPPLRMLNLLHESLVLPDGYEMQADQCLQCLVFHKLGILEVSSVAKAKAIWKTYVAHNCGFSCEAVVREKGIVITRKKKKYRVATNDEKRYAESFWGVERDHRLFEQVTVYNKVFFAGDIFAIGDYVVVKPDDTNMTTNVGYWKARITSFFAMQNNGEYMIFFCAEYFKQCIVVVNNEEQLKIDDITGMSVVQNAYARGDWNSIRPITRLSHKFIPFFHGSECVAFEAKDTIIRKRLLTYGYPGCAPPWLEEHDIVLVQTGPHNFRHAVIRNVDMENKSIKVDWIRSGRRGSDIWTVDQFEGASVHLDECVTILDNWHAITSCRVEVDGILRQIPISWYCDI